MPELATPPLVTATRARAASAGVAWSSSTPITQPPSGAAPGDGDVPAERDERARRRSPATIRLAIRSAPSALADAPRSSSTPAGTQHRPPLGIQLDLAPAAGRRERRHERAAADAPRARRCGRSRCPRIARADGRVDEPACHPRRPRAPPRAPSRAARRPASAGLRSRSARCSSESSRNRLHARSSARRSCSRTARAASNASGSATTAVAVVPSARTDSSAGITSRPRRRPGSSSRRPTTEPMMVRREQRRERKRPESAPSQSARAPRSRSS